MRHSQGEMLTLLEPDGRHPVEQALLFHLAVRLPRERISLDDRYPISMFPL